MASVISDFFSVFKSKIAIILFGLGKTIIIARWLGPEQNGMIASLLVYPTLFMTFGALGIRKSSALLIASGRYEEERIKISVLHSWFISAVFSVVSIFILINFFTREEFPIRMVFLALAPVPFALLITYLSGIYLGNNKIREFNEINWLPPFVTFFAAVCFIIIIDLGLEGALLAELFGPLIMSVILWIKMKVNRYVVISFDKRILKNLFTLGSAFAISLLVINLNYRIDIVILDWLSDVYNIGIYSKGSALSQYLWQLPMMLGTIVFARGARATDRKYFSRRVCQLLRVSLIFIGLGSIFLALLAKYIILVLFGREFLPSVLVMQLLLPGVLLLTIFKVLNMDMGGQGKPWFALKSMVPALVLNVLLNVLLVPTYGATGAAISSTFSYSFAAVLFLLQYSKTNRISLKEIFSFSRSDFAFALPFIQRVRGVVKL